MVEGIIGPVQLDHSELIDGKSISIDGTEEFTIICTNRQARQIMGLASEVNSETYSHTNIVTSKSPWGVVWIDSSTGCSDNDNFPHRGYYLISNAEPKTDIGSSMVHLTVTATKLSSYEHEYLYMDYTPGVKDGTTIEHGYSDLNTVYALQETFTTFDSPASWGATVKDGMTTGSFSASPAGYLCATGKSNKDGTWNGMHTYYKSKLHYPSTLEFDLQWRATPAGYNSSWSVYLTSTAPTTTAALTKSSLRIVLKIAKHGVSYSLIKYNSSGTSSTLKSNISLGTNKTPKFKVVLANSNITIYSDKTGGGTYIKVYSNSLVSAGMNWMTGGFYVAYGFRNQDSTGQTVYSSFIDDYYSTMSSYNNIIALPCTTPLTTADFTRYSEDGNIPCYRNPTTDLYYWQDYEHFYDGSVKAYNSNYTDSTPQLVTWNDEILDPDKFYVTNGLIKLTTSSTATTPVLFSIYASPSGWTDLQIINPGTITLLKPLYVSPERQTYQINSTKWTVQRGKQHVKVEHSTTPLGYTEMDYYDHDAGQTVTPTSADISMRTTYYANVYNTTDDTERFQIIQTEPTIIKSDSIPAASITGLGFYEATPQSTYSSYTSIAKEFFKQPQTRIKIRKV